MTTDTGARGAQRLVLRNTLISFAGQVVGTPLSILVSAVMARYLGPADFGQMYVAFMIVMFGFLFVDWGQGGVLPAAIARDRSVAGEMLASSLAWRLGSSIVVYALLAAGCAALGYSRAFQFVLGMVALQYLLQSLTSACQDACRGFERTDVGALGQVGTQLLALLLIVPTVLLGGGLRGVLIAQAAGAAIVLLLVLRALRMIGIMGLRANAGAIRSLLGQGTPFLFFAFAMAAQPNIDAVMLSRLAPADVVGWHAVARRLIGALVLPGSLVIGALYPTLCRLYAHDRPAYVETARNALRATAVLSVPIALSCALFPDVGIAIFNRDSYGGARDNLIVLSVFLLLMYFSMPLGIAILAAGKQRLWAAIQLGCVVISAALDPLLIPWFQRHWQNGGLGVCTANVVSEIFMLGAGIWLAPRGTLDRALLVTVARTIAAGGAMAGIAFALRFIHPFAVAPVALAGYFVALWLVGGIDRDQLVLLRSSFSRKAVS